MKQLILFIALLLLAPMVGVAQDVEQFSVPDTNMSDPDYVEIVYQTMFDADITLMEDSLQGTAWAYLLDGLRTLEQDEMFLSRLKTAWNVGAHTYLITNQGVLFYADHGDYENAKVWSDRCIESSTNERERCWAHIHAGRLAERMGNRAKAIKHYRRSVKHITNEFPLERLIVLLDSSEAKEFKERYAEHYPMKKASN